MEAERINLIATTLADLAQRAPPSCGGIFDFDAKQERLVEVAQRARRPEGLGRPEARAGARQGKEAARGRRRQPDRASTRACATRRSCSSSRATRTTTRRWRASSATWPALGRAVGGLEFRRMFSNPMDPNNCFLDIQAGAGGTEAQDWAQMLLRMYLRYCERKGFKAEVLEESDGEVAGIKSATLKVDRRLRLRLPAHRDRRAPAGAQVAVRLQRAPPHVVRQRVRLPRGRRHDRDRHQSGRPARSTPTAPRAPAASTSTRPTRRCASRTCRPTSSCSARTTARSTATAPRRWRC